MRGIPVDGVRHGPPDWQVEGVRWQQRVVLVDQRFIAHELDHQLVSRPEVIGKRVDPDHVFVDHPGLDGHAAGMGVMGIAFGGPLIEFPV